MASPPNEFYRQHDQKGENFHEIAELLYSHPKRQFTQDEIAELVDCSNSAVSKHVRKMEDDWVIRRENQTTFSWDTSTHNPASTETARAIKSFYSDFYKLIKRHTETAPGTFAIIGFVFILAALVVFAFFLGLSLDYVQSSTIPPGVYMLIAIGSFLTGVIVTLLSPLQAIINRVLWRYLPESLTSRK